MPTRRTGYITWTLPGSPTIFRKNESSHHCPFELVMGQLLALHMLTRESGKCPAAHQFATNVKKKTDSAKAFLEKATKRMKKWADEGDTMIVKL